MKLNGNWLSRGKQRGGADSALLRFCFVLLFLHADFTITQAYLSAMSTFTQQCRSNKYPLTRSALMIRVSVDSVQCWAQRKRACAILPIAAEYLCGWLVGWLVQPLLTLRVSACWRRRTRTCCLLVCLSVIAGCLPLYCYTMAFHSNPQVAMRQPQCFRFNLSA